MPHPVVSTLFSQFLKHFALLPFSFFLPARLFIVSTVIEEMQPISNQRSWFGENEERRVKQMLREQTCHEQ